MNLNQLKYFSDVARNENITQTAKGYNVPASAVSSSIKRLEDELGTSLFDRTANTISLNEKGAFFANEISYAFERIEHAVRKVTVQESKNTEIRILLRARPKWVAEIINEFLIQRPTANFIISNDYSSDDIENFDIIVDEQSEKYKNLNSFLLSTEIICVKASKNNSLVGKALYFKELESQPFVLPCIGNGMRNRYEKICKHLGISPHILIECNDRQILQYYVQSGNCLTIGAYRALKDHTQNSILPLNVLDFNETQNVFVFYKESQNPIFNDFCNVLYQKRYVV